MAFPIQGAAAPTVSESPAAASSTVSTSGRLTSILDHGLLNRAQMREKGIPYEGGYDEGENNGVYLNVVTKVEGIEKAVFSPADGVFSVGIERALDHAMLSQVIKAGEVEAIIQKNLEQYGAFFSTAQLRKGAIRQHLPKNPDLLNILSKRAHQLAVFILDIPPKGTDALDDPSGAHDAVRESVSKEHIQAIILSRNLADTAEIGYIKAHDIKPIIFVESKPQKMSYSYAVDGTGGFGSREKIQVELLAPAFVEAIKSAYESTFQADGKPMYLHVARI